MNNNSFQSLYPEAIPYISICYWFWTKQENKQIQVYRKTFVKSHNTSERLLNSHYKIIIPFTI